MVYRDVTILSKGSLNCELTTTSTSFGPQTSVEGEMVVPRLKGMVHACLQVHATNEQI